MKTYEEELANARQEWITYNRLLQRNNSAVERSIIEGQIKLHEIRACRIRDILKQRKQNEL